MADLPRTSTKEPTLANVVPSTSPRTTADPRVAGIHRPRTTPSKLRCRRCDTFDTGIPATGTSWFAPLSCQFCDLIQASSSPLLLRRWRPPPATSSTSGSPSVEVVLCVLLFFKWHTFLLLVSFLNIVSLLPYVLHYIALTPGVPKLCVGIRLQRSSGFTMVHGRSFR